MSSRPTQPIPSVSEIDVERVVQRDHATNADEVFALLRTYGVESWEREVPRVQLAILRLAEGDMDRLRQQLDYAKRDYRDVLLGAEYLAYGALTLRTPHPSPEDAQRAIDEDWRKYEEWLRR